jgi:O-antigen ligase
LIGNTFAHDWRNDDPDQVAILPHLIEGYLIPLLLYWIGRRAVVNQRGVDRVYALFAVFGIYLAGTAVLEIIGAWGLVFPKFIADPDRGIHFGRARGPFLQSVRLGIYLLAGLASLWIPLIWRGVWGRGGQLLAACLTPLFLIALFFTYTRSIWLGTALASIILFAMTLYGRPRRAVILAILGCSVALLLVVQEGFTSFQREYGAAETRQSTQMRAVFAYVSWMMFQDKPLTGHGFGHFPRVNQPYLNDRQTTMQLNSIRGYIHHNTFLSQLVELGVVAFLLYVGMLTAWGRQAWQLWRDVAAPAWMRGQAVLFLLFLCHFATQMMFHDVSYSPLENGLLFFLAGLTSSLCWIRSPASTVRRQPAWQSRLSTDLAGA